MPLALWLIALSVVSTGSFLVPRVLAAQTPPGATQAAETVTAARLMRHLDVLAADSMRYRATPSPGLDRAARYMVAQFQALGLTLGGDSGTGLQRYPVPGQLRLNPAASSSWMELHLTLRKSGKEIIREDGETATKVVRVDFTATARFADEITPQIHQGGKNKTVVVTGRHTMRDLANDRVRLRWSRTVRERRHDEP